MSTATQERKTELATQPTGFQVAPLVFDVSMEQIEQLRAEYMPLALVDLADKEQFDRIHEGSMKIGKLIRGVEKYAKEARDGYNKAAKDIIAAERTLTEPLQDIRDHLEDEKAKVKREQERITREAAEARQAKTRDRLQKLQACGKSYMEADIADLPDDEFEELHKAELADKKRRDDEAAAQAAEHERIAKQQQLEALELAKQHKELEAKRVEAEARSKRMQARMELLARQGYQHTLTGDELADMPAPSWESLLDGARKEKAARDKAAADQQAALDKQREEQQAESIRLSAQKGAIFQHRINALREYPCPGIERGIIAVNADSTEEEFQATLAKAKAYQAEYDAKQAEKARLGAIAEQERIAAAEKAHAEAAAAEQARQEELRPDREKIAIFADSIMKMAGPQLSVKSQDVQVEIGQALHVCSKAIRAAGSKLK